MERQVDSNQSHDSTNQAANGSPEISTPSRWHKKTSLPDGTVIGQLGAYWYILDENDRAISDGYHEIYLDKNGDYKGERSARSEPITLYTEPDQ